MMKLLSIQLSSKIEAKYSKEVMAHFRAFDVDNDGLISYEEFMDSNFF